MDNGRAERAGNYPRMVMPGAPSPFRYPRKRDSERNKERPSTPPDISSNEKKEVEERPSTPPNFSSNEKKKEEDEVTEGTKKEDRQKPLLDWVIKINSDLDKNCKYDSGRSWNIHRVPNNLCEVHKKAFVPRLVSIGPLNYRKREQEQRLQVQANEEHKMRFLVRLLGGKFDSQSGCGERKVKGGKEESVGDPNNDGGRESRSVRLEALVSAMKDLENEVRKCYSESFDGVIESHEFVRMLVVDGCFIVGLLHLNYELVEAQGGGETEADDDPIFTTPWMLRALQRDLLMLENQLPFFVLDKLYTLIYKTDQEVALVPLEKLAVTFFNPLLPRKDPASKLNKRTYTHLLDIFRSTFLNSAREEVEKNKKLKIWKLNTNGSDTMVNPRRQLIHCASELQEVGLKLKRRECFDLLDIAFDGDTLQIPPLNINDDTVPLFFNFVVYEQCDQQAKPFFTSYLMFLDSLVSNPNDVQILHNHDILSHVLGSNDDVADLLHKLCREIVYDIDQCYLYDELNKVIQYGKPYEKSIVRKTCWTLWRSFIHRYFSSTWTFFSLLGAIFLAVLTILQTVYAIYTYYGSNSSGLQSWSLKFLF